MTKYIVTILIALALTGGVCIAGEKADEKEIGDALKNLQGLEGIYGGNAEDMDKFLKMVQTPEMTKLVEQLNSRMAAQGITGEADQATIDAFVRENITKEDVEKLLGQKIRDEDFRRAMSSELKEGDVEKMRERMQESAR